MPNPRRERRSIKAARPINRRRPRKRRPSMPSRRLLELRKPRRPCSARRGHRGRRPGQRSWSADIAAAMTSRRPSRRDAMPAAAPASRSAMARPRRTRRPRALGRRRPPSSFGRRSNRIGVWAHRRARAPTRVGSAFATRSNERPDRNQRLRAIRYQAPAPGRSRAKEDQFVV
jgi:hypothetical protein